MITFEAVEHSPPLPQPPAFAKCITATQGAHPDAIPQQTSSSMLRSADGKMRIDFGHASLITDPAAQHTVVLDHIKQVAHVIPIPQAEMPQMPQLPHAPGLTFAPPAAPPVSVRDLGKGFIEGHEVEGKEYTVHPPEMPAAPSMPHSPQVPIPVLTKAEVWTSTQLKMPVLTKVTGSFGQQTCYCKAAPTSEPDPSLFQIPPGYQLSAPASKGQ